MSSKKPAPKPAIINPILNDLTSKLWWEYQQYDQLSKEAIDNFFVTNSKDLQLLMTPNLYDNIQILSKLIGIYTHPLFKTQPKYSILEETQPLITSEQHNAVNSITGLPQTNLAPGLKENILTVSSNALNQLSSMTNLPSDKIEPNFIIINNTKVDYATAKILNYVWSFSKFVVLKLNRNYLDEITFLQFQELVMNTNNKISKFFFEWNILQSEIALPFYNQLALSPSIEFLILRSNALTDEIFVPFCDKLLETNNQILRLLDVYDNNLTKKSFDSIGKLLSTNRTLEYLGLAKNNIESLVDVEEILNNLGRKPLSNEEYEEYLFKDKQKEVIIERNKKIKKKENQEPIPYLDPIQQISEGKFALVKNTKLSCLNFAKNLLDESNIDTIEIILSNCSEAFQLVVNLNRIDEKYADKLRKKYGKKILI